MPVFRTLCCVTTLVATLAAPVPASLAVMTRPVMTRTAMTRAVLTRVVVAAAGKRSGHGKRGGHRRPPAGAPQCSLPTDTSHLPHPVLSARLNKDGTVTFHGRTCPGLLIGVFEVHGKRVRNVAEDLVCDDLANRVGRYSCTSLRRYPIKTKFGVVISGQFIVGLQIAAPRPRRPRHPRPHGAPQTGFGGAAGGVARHHLRPVGHSRRQSSPSARRRR
jgi:hypothetical protein